MRKFFLFVLLFIAAPTAFASGPVLVLGDSLSAAFHIDAEAGWVALLGQRLKSESPPVEVVNASISGETSAGGLARLPGLLSQHKPRVLIVELGANDGLRGLPVAQIRKNIDAIIKTGRDAGAKVVVLGIELPINYGPQYRTALRGMYRDAANEFNVPLVPFLLDGVAQDPKLMQDDGMHPLAAGEPKVLENVWPTLRTALGAK
jgi:acyl-CoA thioesterase I